jgi:hypothetical protein
MQWTLFHVVLVICVFVLEYVVCRRIGMLLTYSIITIGCLMDFCYKIRNEYILPDDKRNVLRDTHEHQVTERPQTHVVAECGTRVHAGIVSDGARQRMGIRRHKDCDTCDS